LALTASLLVSYRCRRAGAAARERRARARCTRACGTTKNLTTFLYVL
jgi:hypothetical protein